MMEVPLPKDHEGREIPLDTEVLYDAKGGEMHVSSYRYQRDVLGLSTGWNVISEDAVGQTWQHPADGLYLNRPDSWEKLEEDLSNGAIGGEVLGMLPYCSYSGSEALACDKCRFGGDNRCVSSVFTDIRNRIRRMRSEL